MYQQLNMLTILFMLSSIIAIQAGQTQRPFYVIAHMANSRPALNWAVAEGANGIESDLRFDNNGNPMIFEHRGICDCWCAFVSGHICSALSRKCSGAEASENAAIHMQNIARLNGIALFLIDSKIDATVGSILAKAGSLLIPFVDNNLFGYGYQGKVVIGVGKFDGFDYIQAAAIAANNSPNRARYFFTFDEQKNDYIGVMDMLARFTKNRVYGTGITSCAIGTYYNGIKGAVAGMDSDENGMTYIWTLDQESSMRTYIDLGVNGIVTNRVAIAKNLVVSLGLKLAQPSDSIPVSNTPIPQQNICDCDYHPGGCLISRPPPSGKACKCIYRGFWTCGGNVVDCNNPNSRFCDKPDQSPATCILGGGDCDGYPENQSCDCSYIRKGLFRKSGCKITRPSTVGLACRCSYHVLWRCSGSPISCSNSQPKCAIPDTSKESCILGGGDCDGY